MSNLRSRVPDLGVGVGLRVQNYAEIFGGEARVDWFEAISENYLVDGGKALHHLDRVADRFPLVLHGVSLGIGGTEPLDFGFLRRLKALARRVNSPWVSDHLCWTRAGGVELHDLLPLPFTEECLAHVAERARIVQEELEVPFALENTSSYVGFRSSTLSEWEFISEFAERADVGLLLDVNNVWVSAVNHGTDPWDFVRGVPLDRVLQVHLAGHTDVGTHLIDTHIGPPIREVLELYADVIERSGAVSTLLEWDDQVPALEVLLAEAERIHAVRDAALARRAGSTAPIALHAPARTAERRTRGWIQGGTRERAE